MRWWMFLAAAAIMSAGTNPDELLARIKARVTETTARLPNYLCTETIERTEYHAVEAHRLRTCEALMSAGEWLRRRMISDRLRLDVAVGSNREMYSWAGEHRFDDREIKDVVGGGPISTGSFTTFLIAIFETNSARFSYKGEQTLKDRQVVEFAFDVPRERSQYRVRAPGQQWAITAYSGELYADANTFDLVRLVVRTPRLPPQAEACQDTTTLDYTRVRLNDADFLLPSEVVLRIMFPDGIETENRTVFSACHEFRGESTVSFDPAPESEGGTGVKTAERAIVLPPNARFTVVFSADLPTAAAAGGDRVPCNIATPIHDGFGVIVPAGTPLTCRLLSVQHIDLPAPAITLVLRLEELKVRGALVRLHAVTDSEGRPPLRTRLGGTLMSIHRANDPNAVVLNFSKAHRDYVVKRGFKTDWVTIAPQ